MRRALERLTIPLNVYWREEMRRGPLYRALSELLRRGDTTAWVAESSALAVECLRYLRERRVRAPQSLSVAGFDDSTESQLAGCTSFDFDMQSVARQTIDLLVATPRAPGARPELREVEVAGFLTVRSSTGPAPRSPGER